MFSLSEKGFKVRIQKVKSESFHPTNRARKNILSQVENKQTQNEKKNEFHFQKKSSEKLSNCF